MYLFIKREDFDVLVQVYASYSLLQTYTDFLKKNGVNVVQQYP